MKNHLRVEIDDEDNLIQRYIDAATDFVERTAQHIVSYSQWEMALDHLHHEIYLPYDNIVSVESIKYYAYNDDLLQTTLPSTIYDIDTFNSPVRIALKPLQSWPLVSTRINSVIIRFTAGYADPEQCPATMRIAILLLAAHYYEHREEATELSGLKPIPMGISNLINLNKLKRYA